MNISFCYWPVLFHSLLLHNPKPVFHLPTIPLILQHSLDSILILGMGISATAIFLDNATSKLISGLRSRNVYSEYRHLGKTAGEAEDSFSRIPLKKYKAILFFVPKDSIFFGVKLSKAGYSLPQQSHYKATPSVVIHSFRYGGSFDLKLYDTGDE